MGYVFSVILSAAITLLLALNFTPIRALERSGIDLGMRVYAAFQHHLDSGFQNPPYRYMFLDLDDGVCRGGSELWTCPEDEPASPALVRALLRLASEAGAAVVVVDVRPPRARADREALVALAGDGAGPLVVAPLVADPKGDRVNLFAPDDPLIPAPFSRGRLRLAPMVTQSDPNVGDGVIRHYPPLVQVGSLDLPTAPLVAAAWVGGGDERIRIVCDRYSVAAGERSRCAPGGARSRDGAASLRIRQIAQTPPGELSPIFWTLSPQLRSADVDHDLRAPFDNTFPYVRVSEARTPDGGLGLDLSSVRGQIVIIGSTSPRSRDLHRTPLGVMSGSELLLNAMRSFLEFGPVRETRSTPDTAQTLAIFWSKVAAAVVPALFVFPAWWAIHAARRRAAGRPWPVRATLWVLGILFFAAMLLSGLLVELIREVSSIRRNAMQGAPVDLVTPIAALGLELFADSAKSLLAQIEVWIKYLSERIVTVGGRAATYLRKVIGTRMK